jgi:hypothetical protein
MLFLLSLVVRLLARLLVLSGADEATKDLEILVLRQQLRVLRLKGAQRRSCSSPVLMEQTTEQVTSVHLSRLILADGSQPSLLERRLQSERPVRPMNVGVLGIDPKDLLEVGPPENEEPVQALGAHRPGPALRVRVRLGCPDRRHHHLATLRAEHVVEAARELRVPIAEQEPHPAPLFAEHQQQVAGLLGDQAPSGLAVTPARWTRRVLCSMKNKTYSRRSQIVSTVKKSHATIPAACRRRNARHEVATRRGAGSSPWRRSVVRIAVADTCTPSRRSSPLIRW